MTVYQSTVGTLVPPPDGLTIPEFMLDRSFLHPDSNDPSKPDWICLVDDTTGRQLRFSELRSRTGCLCAALHEQRKISSGDIVALVSHNDIDYPVCVWAAHRLGAIVAPMSAGMTTDELAYLFKLSSPSVIIVQTESVVLARDAAKRAGLGEYHLVIMDANTVSDLGYPTTGSLIARGKSLAPFVQPPLHPGEGKTKIAFLSFSSGTTGLPKAVCISHYNVISNVLQVEALNHVYDPEVKWADKRYRPGGVCSAVLPMAHIYGLVVNLHFIIYSRMTLVVTAKFNFEKMLQNISRFRITNLFIVPPQALLMCKHPAVQNYDLTSVHACMIAAAPISAELTQSFLRALPSCIHLGQGYGMTETCAAASMYPISPKVGVLGSGGKLMPGTVAKVVKSDGTLAPTGERGELYIKGPQVTLGYYNNPAATNETFIDGWIRTGDETYFDADGNLFIVDRVKELMKVKGHQVAPAELEGHLLGHKDVADVAVIGLPDDFAGELPLAFIVLKPQPASEVKSDAQAQKRIRESLFKHVSTSKSSYKWLTGGIQFVESIPKSASGKILRRVLREQAVNMPRSKL
ncbi:Phenylacetyl-CoA ligase [Mycena sanguinolenta]|uniref:Phenylacetyl-CoA ligase n=1 Tax=Mycena sanguinolenta TaxID=230812 RepID=A0A8H6Z5K3_9AGAR|nr:Phenylacetyl-CoA ligase [Mycena sanguinolenta]